MWLAVGDLAWRHRRPLALALAVLALTGGGCYGWRRAQARWLETGARQEQARQFAERAARAETVYIAAAARTDTVTTTVTRLVDRWRTDTAWRRDTIRAGADSTPAGVLIPLPVLARTDSLVHACSALVTSCADERAKARALLAVKDSELAVLRAWTPPAAPSHATRHVILGALLGGALVSVLHR